MKLLFVCLLLCLLFGFILTDSESQEYWNRLAFTDLTEALRKPIIKKKAKNVIFFLGDGMSLTTITSSRILKGQKLGKSGEEGLLSFEKLPNTAILKTYNVDYQVADSAGTATAFLTGVKTRYGVVAVDENVQRSNCSSYEEKYNTVSILHDAIKAGKQVGLVTTTRITHATPSVTYAHSAERNWESDERQADVDKEKCPDIAKQFVSNALDFRVVFGGGRYNFMSENETDPVIKSQQGKRKDGEDLIAKWKKLQQKKGHKYKYIINKNGLDQLSSTADEYVLGLFNPSHMNFDDERPDEEPSLEEMTKKAIEILSNKNDNGFVLFVEGGRIDHGHHKNRARMALGDTLAFDKAIEHAISVTNQEETLLLVTSDHSHVFTMGGFPKRGNPIFGTTTNDWGDGPGFAKDGKLITTLLYADGPGAKINEPREDVTERDTKSVKYVNQAFIPINYESHGGDDVLIYASGPMAHLFHKVHEQNYIAHVIRFATCIGSEYSTKCSSSASQRNQNAYFPLVYICGLLSIIIGQRHI